MFLIKIKSIYPLYISNNRFGERTLMIESILKGIHCTVSSIWFGDSKIGILIRQINICIYDNFIPNPLNIFELCKLNYVFKKLENYLLSYCISL